MNTPTVVVVTLLLTCSYCNSFYLSSPSAILFTKKSISSTHHSSLAASLTTIPSLVTDPTVIADPTVTADPTSDTTTSNKLISNRINRALSFYTTAIPVFLSYQILDRIIKFQKETLNHKITMDEETSRYNKLHEWGSHEIYNKIAELKGYYVKTGQIISTRVDIFPEQYTSKLSVMQDTFDPLPASVVKDIISKDLLDGADISDVFSEFDDIPLGSASIAQVHKAKLLNGHVVAVKVQRPTAPLALQDIANLKTFAKAVADTLPIDYYKIFCELERTLINELDFHMEAQASLKIASAVSHTIDNQLDDNPPVVVPLPLYGLVSKKVMVMEFVDGQALSKIAKDMKERQVTGSSNESKVLGNKLLSALTDAYGRMVFGSGILHGDPHPGNLFILKDGKVCLLDCGQVKTLTKTQKTKLANLVILVHDWECAQKNNIANPSIANGATVSMLISQLAIAVRSFNVVFKENVQGDECAAAVAILLFGTTGIPLPGGYAGEEISKDSPIVQIVDFPQELVLLGRATVMIKGIANALGINWSLSNRWIKDARLCTSTTNPVSQLSIWTVSLPKILSPSSAPIYNKRYVVRFADVMTQLKSSVRLLFTYLYKKVFTSINKRLSEKAKLKLFKLYCKVSLAFQSKT